MTNFNRNPQAQFRNQMASQSGGMMPTTMYPQGQLGSFGGSMLGQKPSYTMSPLMNPMQMDAMNSMLSKSLGSLMGGSFDFGPIEEQARTGFEEKTLPSIMERLSGAGALHSSAFPQLLGAAGSGLEQSLASMKQNYGLQQQSQMANLLNMSMRPQFETQYDKGTTGMLPDILSLLTSLAGMFAGYPIPKTSGAWQGGLDWLGDSGSAKSGTMFTPGAEKPYVGLI